MVFLFLQKSYVLLCSEKIQVKNKFTQRPKLIIKANNYKPIAGTKRKNKKNQNFLLFANHYDTYISNNNIIKKLITLIMKYYFSNYN